MSNPNSTTSLWRSGDGGTAPTLTAYNAVGLAYSLIGTQVSTPAPNSGGDYGQQSRRVNFKTGTVGAPAGGAGLVSKNPAGWLGDGGKRTSGFFASFKFALAANKATSRGFIGLAGQNAQILNAALSGAVDAIGIGFDDGVAPNLSSGNWHLFSRANGTYWHFDLGASASQAEPDVFLLILAATPNASSVFVFLYNLTKQVLVTSDVVPNAPNNYLPSSASYLFAHTEVYQTNGANGAVELDVLEMDVAPWASGVMNVRDFGAVGDAATDDQPAFQAAIWAASRFFNEDDTEVGGGRVIVPPGRYFLAAPVHVVSGITLEGTQGEGSYGSCELLFDKDIGDIDGPDGGCLAIDTYDVAPIPTWAPSPKVYAVGDLVVRTGYPRDAYYRCIKGGVAGAAEPAWGTAFGTAIADGANVEWTFWGYVPSAYGAIVKNLVLRQLPGGDPLKLCEGVAMRAHARLENVEVRGFQGDGVHVFGSPSLPGPYTNAIGWTIGGRSTIRECGRYGLFVHGSVANSGGVDGVLSVHGNGSFGVWQGDQFGNVYSQIEADSNGVWVDYGANKWMRGESDVTATLAWKPGHVYAVGDLVVPTLAKRAAMADYIPGFQFRCVTAGTSAGVGFEPAWDAHAAVGGAVFPDGTAEWQCWMEEGGPVYTDRTLETQAGPSAFVRIHRERNQGPSDMRAGDVVVVAPADSFMSQRSNTTYGMEMGTTRPFAVTNLAQDPADAVPSQTLTVYVGGSKSLPYEAWRYAALGGDRDDFINKSYAINNANYPRWREQWSEASGGYISVTQPGVSSLPKPGAMCFPNVWLGAQWGLERRLTSVSPEGAFPWGPTDLTDTGWIEVWGTFLPGDIFLNNLGELGAIASRFPLAWRPRRAGAIVTDPGAPDWQANTHYVAGAVIQPGGAGPMFRAQKAGKTGAGPWPGGGGALGDTVFDGVITWMNVGEDASGWSGPEDWDPILIESPTMITIDVTDVVANQAGTLTEDQSAHQRIKLTNTAAASDIAAVPGAANGWVHVFWNAAAHDVTLDAGGATVLLAPGDIFHVMCDGNDYYHVT